NGTIGNKDAEENLGGDISKNYPPELKQQILRNATPVGPARDMELATGILDKMAAELGWPGIEDLPADFEKANTALFEGSLSFLRDYFDADVPDLDRPTWWNQVVVFRENGQDRPRKVHDVLMALVEYTSTVRFQTFPLEGPDTPRAILDRG